MTPASDTPARHAARLPIRLGAAILTAVILFLLLSGSDETHSVSHVIREIPQDRPGKTPGRLHRPVVGLRGGA